jgi:hypothetical protein
MGPAQRLRTAMCGPQAGPSPDGILSVLESALKTAFWPEGPPVSGTFAARDRTPQALPRGYFRTSSETVIAANSMFGKPGACQSLRL